MKVLPAAEVILKGLDPTFPYNTIGSDGLLVVPTSTTPLEPILVPAEPEPLEPSSPDSSPEPTEDDKVEEEVVSTEDDKTEEKNPEEDAVKDAAPKTRGRKPKAAS